MVRLSYRLLRYLLACVCVVAVVVVCHRMWYPAAKPTPPTRRRPAVATNRSQLPSRLARTSCSCNKKATNLTDYIEPDQLQDVKRRRAEEMRKYKLRNPSGEPRLLYAAPNSPLQYPIQGFTVRPLTPTAVPDLGLDADERSVYEVVLSASTGALTTSTVDDQVKVKANGKKMMTIVSTDLAALNLQLASVFYTSTVYHVNTEDFITFRFEEHEAEFAVAIKQPKMPVLSDMGTEIESQVTIITKTFERYQKLRLLLESIRKYYPKILVIVADDSIKRETVEEENVEQYMMPPKKGWFAGRNLGVSQVTTKYFLWVDDDFLFSENTKIEKFVEVMEANPQLDLVSGIVHGSVYRFSFRYEEGDEVDGGCITVKFGMRLHPLPNHPECILVHGAVNFFLARTDSLRRVGFDPKFPRVAHAELFIDGLGSLMVASCNYPESTYVLHQPHAGNGGAYNKYRYVARRDFPYRFSVYYLKNHLKCAQL